MYTLKNAKENDLYLDGKNFYRKQNGKWILLKSSKTMKKKEIALINKQHKTKTQLAKICDKLWAEAVKIVAHNKCEYCGKTDYLNAHHVYSRSNRSTRWDISNGACLCSGHHSLLSTFSAHKTPYEFIQFMIKQRGEAWLTTLQMRANSTHKTDLQMEKLYLENQFKIWKKLS